LIFEHLLKDQESLPEQTSHSQNEDPNSSSRWSSLCRLSLPHPIRSLMPLPTPVFRALTLVNHQIRGEFLQMYRQLLPFRFTLDASQADGASLWKVSPQSLALMRSVRLKILANPGIVGVGNFDPREVTGSWILRDRVFVLMECMTKLADLSLSIQASGNQLWNPLWLWHYTSQAFKVSNIHAFRRMSFEMEGWNLREPNHLERINGLWEWRCADNHLIQADTDGPQPIRKFCEALYKECQVCDMRPSTNRVDRA